MRTWPGMPYDKQLKNKRDFYNSLAEGNKAADLFVDAAVKKGYAVVRSSKWQDINEHWDYMIQKKYPSQKGVRAYKVEVKAMKRIEYQDREPQAELIWIELHGVRERDQGWLNGKADLIAFEQSDHFIVVRRKKLKGLVEYLASTKKVSRTSEALYCLYSRKGRNDQLTMIRNRDILKIKFKIWRK